MMEKGKWKTQYATFQDWYAALNRDLYKRINNLQVKIYGSKKKSELLCKQK